jgi:parvulin-like peptidyl-prolyl isomerase
LAKKKVEKLKGKFTRRQLSRWQQQKKRQRIIVSIGISVIAIVTGLVIAGLYYGWYIVEHKPLKQTVIEVNSTKYNMGYFIEALKYYTQGQSAQHVESLLEPVLESIKRNELIRQKALELDVIISDKEVNDELKRRGLSHNQAISDIVRAQLLLDKLRQEYFEPQLSLSTEQRQIMAMFLESQSQTVEIISRLEAGEDFHQLAGELSLDSLTNENNGDLGWQPKGILTELLNTSVLENFIFSSEIGILSQPLYDDEKPKSLGYWLMQILERRADSEEAHVWAILLASEEEAQSAKARLEAGEDFAQLANDLSRLPGADENSGDLGWLTMDSMSQTVSDFVFDSETELAIISEPIRDETTSTSGGYWLFKIVGSGIKKISDEHRDLLMTKAISDWLVSLIGDSENEVISYLDDEMRAFAVDKA